MVKQKSTVSFDSEDGKMRFSCEADSTLGAIHDFLLFIKGGIVVKMSEAQKEEEAIQQKMKEIDELQAKQGSQPEVA